MVNKEKKISNNILNNFLKFYKIPNSNYNYNKS